MNIFKALPAIMAEIDAIKKTKSQDPGAPKWAFRGIDAFMNALHPLLAKHKVMIVPEVKDNLREPFTTSNGAQMINVILKMNFKAYADDGSFIEGSTIGEAFDSGDKASNKAMSAALKYFVMQTFMVPTEDIEDPDKNDTEGLRGAEKKPDPKQDPKASQYTPDAQKGAEYAKAGKTITEAQYKRLKAIQSKSQWSPEHVKAMIKHTWGADSAMQLNMLQYQTLIESIETLSPPVL